MLDTRQSWTETCDYKFHILPEVVSLTRHATVIELHSGSI